MPHYAFKCTKCNHQWTITIPSSQRASRSYRANCPSHRCNNPTTGELIDAPVFIDDRTVQHRDYPLGTMRRGVHLISGPSSLVPTSQTAPSLTGEGQQDPRYDFALKCLIDLQREAQKMHDLACNGIEFVRDAKQREHSLLDDRNYMSILNEYARNIAKQDELVLELRMLIPL